MNDRAGRTPPPEPAASEPSFNPIRLLIWCSLMLGGSAAIVWVSWFTSGSMSWPVRFGWWTVVLGSLWLLSRKARRFLEAQGWSTADAPPSEHALRGAALIGGIVLSTALVGSTAGRQMVLSAADAVTGASLANPDGTNGPTVITLPPDVPATSSATAITAATTTTILDPTILDPAGSTTTAVPESTPAPAVDPSAPSVPVGSTPPPAAGITRGDDALAAPGQPVVVAVLANDDPGFLPETVTIVVQPPGTAVVNADGTVTVTLDPGVTGTTSFVYRACTAEDRCQNGVVRLFAG